MILGLDDTLPEWSRAWHARAAAESIYYRVIDAHTAIGVYAMSFGKARICLVEDEFFVDGFCYEDPALAIGAAILWTGEGDPLDGWHRNPFNGRRRPGGDPAKEEVRL